MSDGRYEVVAVRYATRLTRRSECFVGFGHSGERDAELRMDYFFWIVRNAERTLLVDTGFAPDVGTRRGRTCLHPPTEALAGVGVEPADVTQIVLTHLHYDHTGNVAAFPHAELVVQRRELDFWSSPAGARAAFADHAEAAEVTAIVAADRAGRVRALDGSATVAPGIDALAVGGHAPGQQMLLVESRRGPVLLASDVLHYYEELDHDRPYVAFADLEAVYAGLDRVRELVGDGVIVVAGHDPAVLDRFPRLAGDAAGLGVQIA
jgi:glyoxylase-like metal-dependent hydrolase (beta-lactamase superfamily II)